MSRTPVPIRLLFAISIALLGLIAGSILGYTAAFFAYLWLHPPSPSRVEFESANVFSLGAAVIGAVGGIIGGTWWGWRRTGRTVDGTISEQKGTDERQNDPSEPSV